MVVVVVMVVVRVRVNTPSLLQSGETVHTSISTQIAIYYYSEKRNCGIAYKYSKLLGVMWQEEYILRGTTKYFRKMKVS